MDSRKLLLRGYIFKDTKHDRFGKRSAATEAEEIDGGGRECSPQVNRVDFSFFSTPSSNNFRFAFLALKVASQAFTWKISICSAKINHVLRCSLSREHATGRACLRTAVRGATSQLQLTKPNEAARCPTRALCAGLKAWAENFAWARNPTRYACNAQLKPEEMLGNYQIFDFNDCQTIVQHCWAAVENVDVFQTLQRHADITIKLMRIYRASQKQLVAIPHYRLFVWLLANCRVQKIRICDFDQPGEKKEQFKWKGQSNVSLVWSKRILSMELN